MHIENWSLKSNQGLYNAPETRRFQILGQVFGHPKYHDGEVITTSYIFAINGCEIETHSGSIYRLGSPDPNYMLWCQENGCHIPTPDEPIKSL